jgi:hypothetical protein
MKKLLSFYFLWLCCLFACNKEEADINPQSEQQKTANLLNGVWILEEVEQKPTHISMDQLQGFALEFRLNAELSGGVFRARNTAGLFGTEGVWSFTRGSASAIDLLSHSGTVGTMRINKVAEKSLSLSFTTPSEPLNARQLGIDGDFRLLLSRE